jgi:hypothetical protein
MLLRHKTELKHPLRYCLLATFLLGVVFFTPHDGTSGQSFLTVAQSAAWFNPAEWMAAWCSLKLIMFCLGVFFLAIAVEELVITSRHEILAKIFLLLATLPVLASLMGVYLLVKAVF